ncbi:MAG: hypothetical protein ACR2MG_13780, partial [Pyrinomonadaceae bacterium]
MKADLGADITDLIIQSIEGIIAKNSGATLEEINDELIIRCLELCFLDVLSKKYQDITPFLLANFDYDKETENYLLTGLSYKKLKVFNVIIKVSKLSAKSSNCSFL